jgi:hypothetical protein
MGLDMYLTKKTYVENWPRMSYEEKYEIIIKKGGEINKNIQPERITYIIENIAYWRKANAIHKWFVDNIQDGVDDCKEYYININDIKKLIDVCKQVKESLESSYDSKTNSYLNTKVAQELLPSQMGFFFGDTDYNEYYLEDINNTINQLEPLLKEKENEYFYYQSSW